MSSEQIRKLINILETVETGRKRNIKENSIETLAHEGMNTEDRLLIALLPTVLVGYAARTITCAAEVIVPIVIGLPLAILGITSMFDKKHESMGDQGAELAVKVFKHARLNDKSTIGDYFSAIADLKVSGKLNDSQISSLQHFNTHMLEKNLLKNSNQMERYGIDPENIVKTMTADRYKRAAE